MPDPLGNTLKSTSEVKTTEGEEEDVDLFKHKQMIKAVEGITGMHEELKEVRKILEKLLLMINNPLEVEATMVKDTSIANKILNDIKAMRIDK